MESVDAIFSRRCAARGVMVMSMGSPESSLRGFDIALVVRRNVVERGRRCSVRDSWGIVDIRDRTGESDLATCWLRHDGARKSR